MKHIKPVLLILPLLFLFSCAKDIPEEDVFDNPLDEDEVIYDTPALTWLTMHPNCLSDWPMTPH